ncbi:restriction endonuclease subunit S [Allomuricauda sp. F6463D]|uniref:restriction endonuclease subunit S n=1 Tax=Allomuricauda sp. F6463D TaxID=2926409 RepID=UPI001FF63D43|nr:restriction endonuclease subunit S [Muricauda sp. F6463D]MCK0159041.1 restriction endonuclease subunit S [Muricauda sp. F6463D]
MKEQKLVPKLRFEEFSGEWETIKLGLLCSKVGSGSTPSGGQEVYQQTGIPFIRSQNVINNELVLDNTCISESINSKMKGSIVKGNDILLNITGGSIGRSCVVPTDFKIGNVNQHVSIIRLKQDEPKFVQSFLASYRGQKLILRGQTGSGREGLNFQSIRGFKVNIPTLPEQQKTASFLSSVDKKIGQLQQKKSLLEDYKKGVMQQIFSQKLRFMKEDGSAYPDWEEKRLGDFCEFFSGGTPRSTNKKFYLGTIPFIGSGNISDEKVYSYISEEALNSSSAKMVVKGDLLYALYGATSGEVALSKINGAINQAVMCIRTIADKKYLFHLLKYNKERIVKTYIQGGQGNLSGRIVSDLKFNFPCLEEQTQIAHFLSAIDKKIAVVQTQIEKTQTFKKGLLQQMFV